MTRTGRHVLRRAVIALLPAIALLALTPPAAWALGDQTNGVRAAGARGGESTENLIGVYVTSLRDFDTADDSFGADFWVWSVHPPGDNPLNSMEFVNSEQLETRLEQTTNRGDRELSPRP